VGSCDYQDAGGFQSSACAALLAAAAVVTPPKVGPAETRIWWQWVQEHVDHRFKAHSEELATVIGEAMAEWVGRKVDPLERELKSLKGEFEVLSNEMRLVRGLTTLREEVAQARREMPSFPAVASRLEAEQERLQGEVLKLKNRVGKVQVEQSIAGYNLTQLQKRTQVTSEASIEMEFASQSAHFQMRAVHPAAARSLREFAMGIINGQSDGVVWLPGAAGTA
jgi:hypothetical protein